APWRVLASGKPGPRPSRAGGRTKGCFVGFGGKKAPVGPPRADRVEIGVLVFLKRAHGSQAAEVAKSIFDCGLRVADCGLQKAEVRGGEGEKGRRGGGEKGRGGEEETLVADEGTQGFW